MTSGLHPSASWSVIPIQSSLCPRLSLTVAKQGPEYVSLVSAEAKRPRTYVKNAFKTLYWRFGLFFVGGSLAVGILVAYNDPGLVSGAANRLLSNRCHFANSCSPLRPRFLEVRRPRRAPQLLPISLLCRTSKSTVFQILSTH